MTLAIALQIIGAVIAVVAITVMSDLAFGLLVGGVIVFAAGLSRERAGNVRQQ